MTPPPEVMYTIILVTLSQKKRQPPRVEKKKSGLPVAVFVLSLKRPVIVAQSRDLCFLPCFHAHTKEEPLLEN